MDDQLGPWLVVGGYVVAFGLLWLGSRWDGRRPALAAVAYGIAGIAFSETTLFWLSAGTDSAVPDLLWFAFPLLIAMWWMSFSRVPDKGEVVDIAVGPLWWHPYIEAADAAVFMLLISLMPLLAGTGLAKATFRPRQRGLKRTPVS